MTNKKNKIKILGAGISGLTTAIILAKNGFEVEIFEKRQRIGSFFERDVHSLRNYDYDHDIIKKYKSLGIEITNSYPIFRELRFSPSLKCIEIYSEKKPMFYNFLRGYKDEKSFDLELYKKAKKIGVKFHFGKTLNTAQADVIATGSSSVKGVGYGAHYSNVSELDPNSLYIFLDNRYSDKGYCYIVPFYNEASVVITSTQKLSKKEMKAKYNSLVQENPVIKKILKNSKFENEIFGYAYYDLPKTAIKENKLYVGEAAGFLDAAMGFGTHYAIISGYLAAIALIENKNYDELWKNWFGDELKEKYLRRLVTEKMENNDYELVIESLLKKYNGRISVEDYRKLKKS